MKSSKRLLVAAASVFMVPSIALAHEVPNMPHTHAFENSEYGQAGTNDYGKVPQQTRSVNNELGNISITSPQRANPYGSGSTVNFARPTPITKPPGAPVASKQSDSNPARNYGKDNR